MRRAPRGQYQLCAPLSVFVGMTLITIPEGFMTDGGTIPPLCWLLVGHPYSPSSLRAVILHDWLCKDGRHGWSSTFVHGVLYAALRADGVAWARARAMWLAAHWFGPTFKAAR